MGFKSRKTIIIEYLRKWKMGRVIKYGGKGK